MFKDYTLQTSGDRAMYALIGGAAVGAAIITPFIAYSFFSLVQNQNPNLDVDLAETLASGAVLFAIAFAYWGIGLAIFGIPVWIVLHFLGFRTWLVALIVGFVICFMLGLWMAPDFIKSSQSAIGATLGNSTIVGLLGSIVALTIWRIAYRRPAPC